MLTALRPYEAYKDSALRWLGQLPHHWEEKRAKFLFREVDERSESGTEELLSVSHITGVTPRREKNVTMFMAESTVGYKICRPGDLVVNTMWAWMGALGISPLTGLVSPAYGVYRPITNSLSPGFAGLILRGPQYVSEYVCRSTGIQSSRLRLYPEQLLQIPVAIPPMNEQRLIERFLAYVDRRIRRFIRAKTKLIALLNEQKHAITQRAMMRGHSTSVRQRASGLTDPAYIPAHWEVLALKRVLRSLHDCAHKTAPAVEKSDYRVIRTTAVRHGRFRLAGTYCTTLDAFREWTARGVPEPGDVVFTREAPAGEACVVPPGHNLCLGQRTVLMKVRTDRCDPSFLVNMIYWGPPAARIRLASQGSTVGHFNMDDIASMTILLPPHSEQLAILQQLARETRPLDVVQEQAEREVVLLREYRTRLIADVVTGKLDVRQVVAGLPEDEGEEPELDEEEDAGLEDDVDTGDAQTDAAADNGAS